MQWNGNEKINTLQQWCPHFFGLQATFKMTKSKWSTYIKNDKHIFIYIYTDDTSYIQYMLVYWREVSVVVSMNSPKVSLHISLLLE